MLAFPKKKKTSSEIFQNSQSSSVGRASVFATKRGQDVQLTIVLVIVISHDMNFLVNSNDLDLRI